MGQPATSTRRKAVSVAVLSSLRGRSGESQAKVQRCRCWGSLRAIMQMRPVKVSCGIYQKGWTEELSFPGPGISGSAALPLESLIQRRMPGPTPELRSRSAQPETACTSPQGTDAAAARPTGPLTGGALSQPSSRFWLWNAE